MKYFYLALTMLSLSVFMYPDTSEPINVQYYDMSDYEITITPKR